MDGNNTIGYVLGALAGILVGLLLVLLITKVINKAGGKVDFKWSRNAENFDERQKLARGDGYKWAFFTLMIYVTVVSLLDDFEITGMFMSFGGMWIGLCLAIFVFAAYCILKDAYMSLYENAKGVIMLFSSVCIMNLIASLRIWKEHMPLVENGAITSHSINAVVAVLFFAVTTVFAARVAYNNKHMEDED